MATTCLTKRGLPSAAKKADLKGMAATPGSSPAGAAAAVSSMPIQLKRAERSPMDANSGAVGSMVPTLIEWRSPRVGVCPKDAESAHAHDQEKEP